MIDLLLSYTFTNDTILQLKLLIKRNNENYVILFNNKLKPKHHILIHYPTIIQKSGPPRHFWCFRFEGKHKEMKTYAQVTLSRKNITLTLAKKFQMKFSNLIFMKTTKPDILLLDKHQFTIDTVVENIIFQKTNLQSADYKIYSELQYRGTTYKTKFYLTKGSSKDYIFEISAILEEIPNNKIHIIAKQIVLNDFNSHFVAYELSDNPQIYDELSINDINVFNGPPLNITQISTGHSFVRLKDFY